MELRSEQASTPASDVANGRSAIKSCNVAHTMLSLGPTGPDRSEHGVPSGAICGRREARGVRQGWLKE